MQKTADRSNSHTSKIIQLPNITSSLPISKSGNALVTELLPKSAYSCPFEKSTSTQIVSFLPHYQSAYTNFDFSSFSRISCIAKEPLSQR